MAMETVQIRLTQEQLKKIDAQVKAGKYPSRSEAIRDYVRKAEFFEALERFAEITEQEGIDKEEAFKALKRIRKKTVYQEMFGQER
ncbi:MAG: ribbon-helix-helix domain-containing protein [Candidatus Bipolaricaulia bacterium]